MSDVVACVAPLNDCLILSHRASSRGVQVAAKVVDKSRGTGDQGLLSGNGLVGSEVLGESSARTKPLARRTLRVR